MISRPNMYRILGKQFRGVKAWLLVHRPPVITRLFFALLYRLNNLMTSRRTSKDERMMNVLWKQNYHAYYADHPERCFRVETDFPVAYQSDDHLHPHGTIRDNSRNYRFNLRLYRMLGYRKDLSLLDLGCAGGGLVRSFLEDGFDAVGVEGSDESLKTRTGEWDNIPRHLFTCDIVKPFRIHDGRGQEAQFDVVTAWEVLEHIPEEDLPQLVQNIRSHLKRGGYFICSIAFFPDGDPRLGAIYHKTLKPTEWWIDLFAGQGLRSVKDHPFEPADMVRGNGMGFKDWHPDDGLGAHLVLRKDVD